MSDPILKWLHISDLHSGKDALGHDMLAITLVDFLKRRKAEAGIEPDLIFFSGDIADQGRPENYTLFTETVLLPLLELYGESFYQKVFFVPGNHDVDRNVNPLVVSYRAVDRLPRLLDTNDDGLALRQGLVERFGAFQKAMPTTEDMASMFGKSGHFVREIEKHGVSIAILGLNTSWFCCSDADKGELSPGRYIVQQGINALAGAEIKIVLGHHPVSWFREDDSQAVNAMFARQNVFYLHGHLHENVLNYVSHGADEYLDIQTGALFESREPVRRPHTIIFGELNHKERICSLEPYQWSPENHEWALASSGMPERFRAPGAARWNFPYPKSRVAAPPPGKGRSSLQLPPGWVNIARSTVTKWTETPLPAQNALSFFDGRPPTWVDAASLVIPSRVVVATIVNDILEALGSPGASVYLVTGPSGEGKSTVLKQVCCAVMRRHPETKFLFRNDDDAELPSEFVLNELGTDTEWLIVADEAANLAQAIYFQSQILARNSKAKAVFLLAARDTDWIAKDARALKWRDVCAFREYILRGIELSDARSIVRAWGQYGKPGLQKLAGYNIEDAAKALVAHSQLEDEPNESAFLGAMLRVRYGAELQGHIDTVLERLQQRTVVSDITLLDAFARAVAMHRIGLRILTKTVLAHSLSLKETDIRRLVLNPLGDEAVVSSGGGVILTRHKAIAEVAYSLLENRHHFDFKEIYKDLVSSALIMISQGLYVPNAGKWRYASREILESGSPEIALEVATTVVELDPTNTFLIVHLASLHRATGRTDLALKAFRTPRIEVTENRGFFTEWGAAEQSDDSHFAAVWILLWALRDIPNAREVTNDDVTMTFVPLFAACRDIYQKYNLIEFAELANIASNLTFRLPLNIDRTSVKDLTLGLEIRELAVSSENLIERMNTISFSAEGRAKAGSQFLPSRGNAPGLGSLGRLVLAAEEASRLRRANNDLARR